MIKKVIKRLVKQFIKKEIIPIKVPICAEKEFDGKTALITGGCGGIGFAIAESLNKKGCSVIITGTNKEKLNRSVSELDKAKGIILNLQDIHSIDSVVEEAFGLSETGVVDILINAAGLNSRNTFWNTSIEEYDKIMTVNVKATYFLCQSVAKRMVEKKTKGHILNVSSSSALRPAWSPYRISKWIVSGLTQGLADILLPYGIIVNAIAPGPTATAMMGLKNGDSIDNEENPSGRYATPEEIAYLATYLVSNMADMVVGDTFYITGGSGTISYHR